MPGFTAYLESIADVKYANFNFPHISPIGIAVEHNLRSTRRIRVYSIELSPIRDSFCQRATRGRGTLLPKFRGGLFDIFARIETGEMMVCEKQRSWSLG
jgi:hypothetical protein